MYLVYCDGKLISDPGDEDLVLIDPKLDLELNSCGSFECYIPPTHPCYDLPQKMTSRVQVYQDGAELFTGRVIEETIDFYKRKKIYCEGELAFLNDSIQRPAEYHNISVRDYLATLIEEHNAQVEEDKQFEIGYVTVADTNDSLYRYTNYNSTMEEIREDLIDDLGGYIRVRNQNGHRYIDYVPLEDYGVMNEQTIEFGENLLDYSQNLDMTDIATVIIPLGAKLEDSPIAALEMRLTVESVNGGSDCIQNDSAVSSYGKITKTVTWDDITVASNLLERGKAYLSDYQFEDLTLEVGAVDLHYTDAEIEQFHLGDQIRVISAPHGLDRWFPLSKMSIYLNSPGSNTFTLGTKVTTSFVSRVSSVSDYVREVDESITPTQKILNSAKEQATNLITAATHGYVVMQPNEEPEEILIMNTPDISTATKLWRWNLGGLGYSSTGYNGTYGTAITMDGAIVADYITTGTLTANVIKAGTIQDVKGNNSWNLDTGVLNCTSGTFSGTLSAATGTFSGSLSAATGTFAGSLSAVTGTFTSIYTGSHSSYSSTANGFYAGTDGLSLGSNFRVSNTGAMTCTSGSFSGTITSTSGTIGGWVISSSGIYYGTSSTTSTTNGTFIGTAGIRQYSGGNYLNITSSIIENGESGDGNYTQLSSGALALGYSGSLYGTFATSVWSGVSGTRGITLHAEYRCDYIGFGHKSSSSATTYTCHYYISYNSSISSYRHNFSGSLYCSGDATFDANVNFGEDGAAMSSWYSSARGEYGVYCSGALSTEGSMVVGNTNYGSSYVLHVKGAAYASGGWAGTSDVTLKSNVEPLSAKTETFLDKLEPISFTFKDDDAGKTHFGVTYQNVCEALEAEGIDPDTSGVVGKALDENGEEKGALYYDELIAPLIYEVKALKSEMQDMRTELETMKKGA